MALENEDYSPGKLLRRSQTFAVSNTDSTDELLADKIAVVGIVMIRERGRLSSTNSVLSVLSVLSVKSVVAILSSRIRE